jgi:hypothetical protein
LYISFVRQAGPPLDLGVREENGRRTLFARPEPEQFLEVKPRIRKDGRVLSACW